MDLIANRLYERLRSVPPGTVGVVAAVSPRDVPVLRAQTQAIFAARGIRRVTVVVRPELASTGGGWFAGCCECWWAMWSPRPDLYPRPYRFFAIVQASTSSSTKTNPTAQTTSPT